MIHRNIDWAFDLFSPYPSLSQSPWPHTAHALWSNMYPNMSSYASHLTTVRICLDFYEAASIQHHSTMFHIDLAPQHGGKIAYMTLNHKIIHSARHIQPIQGEYAILNHLSCTWEGVRKAVDGRGHPSGTDHNAGRCLISEPWTRSKTPIK